jgi:hypothetical protein
MKQRNRPLEDWIKVRVWGFWIVNAVLKEFLGAGDGGRKPRRAVTFEEQLVVTEILVRGPKPN